MKKHTRFTLIASASCLAVCSLLAAFTPVNALLFSGKKSTAAVAAFAKSDEPGALVTFSETDFTSRVAGRDTLDGIVLSELPDPELGSLRLAGRTLSAGDSIAREDFALLCFVPLASGDVHTRFSFLPVFSKAGVTEAAVQVAVNLSATPNSSPIALDLSYETYVDLPLCAALRSVDFDGDGCSYAVLTAPQRGEVTVTGEGFHYTPAGKSGSDSFTYVATDAFGNASSPATVTLDVRKRPSGSDVRYTDMMQSTAHYEAVKLAEAGVLTGERIGSDSFLKPSAPVTRAEFVALVTAATDLPVPTMAVSTGLADNDAIPAWAQPYIASAIYNGVVRGEKNEDGNSIFRASDTLTRAEAAAILTRAAALPANEGIVRFTDEVPAWAADAMETASAAGVLPAFADGTARAEQTVTREEAVHMLYAIMKFADK
ncbi:MAG: S-layer homology domain-containing protein [Clostridia bacterium]|nr:S-layer homology domain-containing protein [Clostridia bacterium]